MGNETSKSIDRRRRDPAFADHYFVGHGIDIGAGNDCLDKHRLSFPKMLSCRRWDMNDGDAKDMAGIADNIFDFVHSSHCLEHLTDPYVALDNWLRILKPGGYLVVIVPDEDMYEQGRFPSTFNGDHKVTFTTWKPRSWCSTSVNVFDLVRHVDAEPIKIESLHATYDWTTRHRWDQTCGQAEAAIEFILRKRMAAERIVLGRLPGVLA